MSEENTVQDLKSLINTTFNSIKVGDMENAESIMSIWNKVLMRIKSNVNPNEGRNLCEHSRVIDLKKGLLIIEADHPGWINLLQMHKNFILKGMKMELPELNISNMAFKLKGKKSDVYASDREEIQKQTREEVKKRLEEDEDILKKAGFTEMNSSVGKKSNELPPELAAMFEEMKNSVLTNSKK